MTRYLKEGSDFYWENGRIVLTAQFLSSRGFCCNSRCRNCPFKTDLREELQLTGSISAEPKALRE